MFEKLCKDIESFMPKCPKCNSIKELYELVYYKCLECRNSVILSEGLSSSMMKEILDELNGYSNRLSEIEFEEGYTEYDFKRFEDMGKIPISNYKMTDEFRQWLQQEHHRVYRGQSVKCPKCDSLYCVRFTLIYECCKKCSYAKLFRSLSEVYEDFLTDSMEISF